MRFMVQEMEFMGQPTKALVCDSRVASALTSISNCLLLRNELSLDAYDAKIDQWNLEKSISRGVFDSFRAHMLPSDTNKAILDDFFRITKRLKNGIEVKPGSGTKFHSSREIEFFGTLGVPLLHASAFNEQVFPTLQENLQNGQVAILYLNKEFNTICKYNGTVFMLVEDEVIQKNHPSARWKTMVNGKEVFAATDFSFITPQISEKMHMCLRCSKGFCTDINNERHSETHLPAYKKTQNNSWNEVTFAKCWDESSYEDAVSILSVAKKVVEEAHKSPVESIIRKWVMSPEFRVAPPEVRDAVRQLKDIVGMASQKPSSNVLLHILKVGSEDTFVSTNLLKGSFAFVEADKTHQNPIRTMLTYFSLKVEELLVERWYDEAIKLSNLAAEELTKPDIDTSSQELESTYQHKNVGDNKHKIIAPVKSMSASSSKVPDPEDGKDKKERKLLPEDISHLPELHGEQYFPNFVSRKRLVRIYTLFNRDKITALTRVGRKVGKRLLKYILKVHKSGLCWHGKWDILDVRVRGDGREFSINKEPTQASSDGIVDDLQKFIVQLYPYYKLEGIKGPCYFDEFHSDVMSLPELSSGKFETFQKFLADHMVFMPPLARSVLLERLFKWCDGIRSEQFDSVYLSLVRLECCWTAIRSEKPYNDVFFHNKSIPKPYGDHYWDLLRFIRNFFNHVLDYTKVDGVQFVEDDTILELMLANDLGEFITKLVLHVLYVFKKPNCLTSTWIAFQTSDDATEENDENETEENDEKIEED